jgi:hypothetical protein
LTFICCVEAGGLEEQTVRMIDSLRRWGGRFSACPVVAVTPRRGVPISRRTRSELQRLGARYLFVTANERHAWFKFLNKPHALVAASPLIDTEQVCWVDSDMFFVREPSELVLGPDEDFDACPSDRNIGTSGDDDWSPYWKELTRLFGMQIADLPIVTAWEENVPIRFYFNSGLFCYRESSGFARRYLEGCERVLDSRISSRHSTIFFTDQVALGLVALTMGLRWRALPLSHNYAMTSRGAHAYAPEQLKSCAICHYHDYLWEPHYATLVQRLDEQLPEVARWVRASGPIRNRMAMPWKLANALLRKWRDHKTEQWVRTCRVV